MAVSQANTKYIKLGAASDAVTGVMVIDYLRWVGASLGNALSVQDGSSVIIAESTADINNFVDIIPINGEVDGLVASTMEGGSLMIYLK